MIKSSIMRQTILLFASFMFLWGVGLAQPGNYDFLKKAPLVVQPEADPLSVTELTLDNGLKVYLNYDPNISNVFGAVAVKGGSKRDPENYTGIAHYFEHIMFKGTDQLGTINYQEEKVYLDSIEWYYGELAKTSDDEARKSIQKEINRLSVAAADLAIPNELDKVLEKMGGVGVNAFTNKDAIVYFNMFPGTQMEKWLEVYSHRFEHPVYRLFQTELETVYEEKNMYSDNPFTGLIETFEKEMFKGHPYSRSIIGETEHLKNPGLKQMHEYFQKYYVANNMALILVGNFDVEAAIPLIKEKFGKWRKADVEPLNARVQPFENKVEINKRLTPIKIGLLGFPSVPSGHPDELALSMVSSVLNNGASTGLLDRLMVDSKLLAAQNLAMHYSQAGVEGVLIVPKILGQNLGAAEKLVLDQIDSLKSGNFSDDLFEAVKAEMLVNHERALEEGQSRGFFILNCFLNDKPWQEVLDESAKIKALSKEDIIAVANKYYTDKYLVLNSKTGFPKKDKLDKPGFEALEPKNAEAESDYAKSIDAIPAEEQVPHFTQLNRDYFAMNPADNVHFYFVPNPVNQIFELNISFGTGSKYDPLLEYAAGHLDLLGTKDKTQEEYKQELQKLGSSVYFNASENNFNISVSGLDENLEKTLHLLRDFMANVTPDDSKLKVLIQGARANFRMEKKTPDIVADALKEKVLYDSKSDYLDRYGIKDLKKLKSQQLIDAFKSVFDYEVVVSYTGTLPQKKVESMVMDLALPKIPTKKEMPVYYLARKNYSGDQIFFVNDKKAIQSQIDLVVEGVPNDRYQRIQLTAFNKYFSSDMSSLVFQEIREFKSLAYSAYAVIRSPYNYEDKNSALIGAMSTQADKSIEALETLSGLIKNMPQKPERIDHIREALLLEYSTYRPGFRSIPGVVNSWRRKGYVEDPRKYNYEQFKNITFDDVLEAYQRNVQGRPITITIVGDAKRIDMDQLKTMGQFHELKKKNLFKN